MEDAFSPASIAARVADRYTRLPSYRDVLEARASARDLAPESSAVAAEPAHSSASDAPEPPAPSAFQPSLLSYSVSSDSLPALRSTPPEARVEPQASLPGPTDPGTGPGFEPALAPAVIEPTQPLPASLVAHPRELVAPAKARPRLAEGPLRDEPFIVDPASPEVDATPQAVANSPAGGEGNPVPDAELQTRLSAPDSSEQSPPEWRSIHLDTEVPIARPQPITPLLEGPVLHVATLQDRALAALFDCALTLTAFLVFAFVFAISSTSFPRGRVALVAACAVLFAMGLLYQLLFFSLTDATPGMRYAKIALCTFDDENPTRSALRGRIAALLLSALPLGLGFLWAVFDEDSLGWHDRITRTYQRSYREL